MKYRHLLIPLLLLLSPVASAASIFDIPLQDQSMLFLSMIFGSVGDVLPGGNTSLLKGAIIDFNYAVLVLGGIIIIYSLVISTVNTAHHGEALGKEWNSVWIPMRAALGFALLLPVNPPDDYALIQVLAMWVVREGVGAADFLWSNGIDRIGSGQATVSPFTGGISGGSGSQGVYTQAQKIYVSQVCARQASSLLGKNVQYSDRIENKEVFGIEGVGPADICGSVEYEPITDPSGDSEAEATNRAITELWQSTDRIAEKFLNYYNQNPQLTESQVNTLQRDLQAAAMDYTGAVAQINSQATAGSSLKQHKYSDALDQAKERGWIYAGSYYITLTKVTGDAIDRVVRGPSTSGMNQQKLTSLLGDQSDSFNNAVGVAKGNSTPSDVKIESPEDVGTFFQNNLFNVITQTFARVVGEVYQFAITGTGANPIMAIAGFGRFLAAICVVAWVAFVAAMVALALVLYGASGSILINTFGGGGMGYALTTGLNLITAPLQVAIGSLFLQGLIMGYYIPMIPFIVFTVSAVGWLMLVIEAMVAAPILAIGILHPEGQHTVWGRGEPGIMLLASLFLRPSLMIVGFFASIVMSYVVIVFINIGFMPVLLQNIGSTGGSSAGGPVIGAVSGVVTGAVSLVMSPFGLIMMLVIYTMLLMIGVNKCFSLIHVVPDRLMRWIGHTGEMPQSAEQELAQLKGGAEAGAGVGKEAGSLGAEGTVTGTREARADAKERREKSGPKKDGGVTGS